jgi:hypothetical protein
MHLFIANPTRQPIAFLYRTLENNKVLQQNIGYGQQVKIAGDLSTEEIDYIIGQYRKYGIVKADDMDSNRGFVGICYSVGKPISSIRIDRTLRHNQFVLIDRGKKQRQAAAIQEMVRMEDDIIKSGRPERLVGFEASIVEHNHNDRDELPPIAEGIRVTRNANPDGTITEPAAPKRRGRRAASN